MSVHLCRNVILIVTLVSAAFTLVAAPVAAQQLPAPPAPVAVSLDPATTALLVLLGCLLSLRTFRVQVGKEGQ